MGCNWLEDQVDDELSWLRPPTRAKYFMARERFEEPFMQRKLLMIMMTVVCIGHDDTTGAKERWMDDIWIPL
jgi:hypothetical protein